jgi:acyl-CoA reductase-like NAD-dependent aldehyde dehydrogenase
MVSAQAAQRATALVDDAREHGATILGGGALRGAIMQPTIVDRVSPAMKLYAEESFAPVVTVLRVDSDDEAVQLANDSEFGLSAAVFSRDIARAMSVAKRVESGICHINGPTVHDEAQMPFGGVKGSGYGRFGSKASIAEFTDLRWITIQTGPRHYPI